MGFLVVMVVYDVEYICDTRRSNDTLIDCFPVTNGIVFLVHCRMGQCCQIGKNLP